MELGSVIDLVNKNLGRRRFLQASSAAGLGLAATTLIGASAKPLLAQGLAPATGTSGVKDPVTKDTPTEIFTAALIAEDLATTFYYNGLVGPVIQDPSLAGPGGTATHVTSAGNFGNVDYLRAALSEEIAHANLFRALLGISSPANDPVQTFYFPSGVFDTLAAFIATLEALEDAFIGAYLAAIHEFARMASIAGTDSNYTRGQLAYYSEVAGAILGIESEHRVLGRVISNQNPANNRNYESVHGIYSVYNGSHSAVVALTPFLTASTGPAYTLAVALSNASSVDTRVSGGLPPE
ncbi:MAG: ferritin-like domain-containing protein [Terriglobales bacterium]